MRHENIKEINHETKTFHKIRFQDNLNMPKATLLLQQPDLCQSE